jgi:hypothetical protein
MRPHRHQQKPRRGALRRSRGHAVGATVVANEHDAASSDASPSPKTASSSMMVSAAEAELGRSSPARETEAARDKGGSPRELDTATGSSIPSREIRRGLRAHPQRPRHARRRPRGLA